MNTILKSNLAKAGLGLVAGLVAMSGAITAGAQTTGSCYTFSTYLAKGSKGTAVKMLQVALNSNPATALAVAAGTAGSAGYETTNFGPATVVAAKKFQTLNGLVADAKIGAMTRAKLNALCTTTGGTTGGTTTGGTSTAGSVNAMLSTDNPAAGTVIMGQATADLMHVTFTGSGTVTSMTFQRTGLSVNTDLTNVYLYQGATRLTDSAAVNSSGVITFNGLSLPVSGMTTISVKADISNSAAGSSIGLNMTGFAANGATGTANLVGNQMYIATGTGLLGSVVVATSTTATVSVNAGAMNYTLWTSSVSANTHSMLLKGASFKFVGSAPNNSLANLGLYVDGVKVASSAGVNQYGYIVFDMTSSPFTLSTGAHTVDVRGDIVNGASRSLTLSLQSAGDFMVTDATVGVNVAPVNPLSTSTTFSTVSGNTISITTGSLAISLDPTFTSMTNVTGGASNAVIGRWKINSYGEDEKITSVTLTPTITGTTTAATSSMSNVQLYFNGSQVGSVCQYNASTGACTFNLGSSVIVPGGSTASTLEVRGDVRDVAGNNYVSGTIQVASATLNAQGMYSGNTISSQTIPSTSGLTVQTGTLGLAKNTSYASQTFSPNTTHVLIGSYVLQNQSSSESVRVTNYQVDLDLVTASASNYTNLVLDEASGAGMTPINPTSQTAPGTSTNNFSVNFTLAPGQTKTLNLYADIGSAASGTITTAVTATARGVSSNVNATTSEVLGQVITVGSGTLSTPTFVSSASTQAQYVAAGTTTGVTDATKSTFNFKTTSGTATISELKFTNVATSGTVTAVRVGSVTAPMISDVAWLQGLNLTVPNTGAGLDIDAFASYAGVGTSGVTSSSTAKLRLTYAKYTIGGTTTENSSLTVNGNQMTLVAAKPSVAVTSSSVAGLNIAGVSNKIGEFTVTANGGAVSLDTIVTNLGYSGFNGVATSTAFLLKVGSTTVATSTTASVASTTGGTVTFDIYDYAGANYTVNSGSPVTFSVYATVTGTAATSATAAVSTSFNEIDWVDVAGSGSAVHIDTSAANQMPDFPTTGAYTIHQ